MKQNVSLSVEPAKALIDLVGSRTSSLVEVFFRRANLTPDLVFLSWREDGEPQRWTYAEAWESALAAAGTLESAGVDRGDRVAVILPNSPETVWAWLGTLLLGALHVPLNPEHLPAQLTEQLDRAKVDVVIVAKDQLSFTPRVPVLFREDLCSTGLRLEDVRFPERADTLGSLLFTSGSTGRTKAAILTQNHYARAASALVSAFELDSSDVIHGWLPLFHVSGQLHVVTTAAIAGAEVALYPKFSASRFWDQVRESSATYMVGFPAVMTILLNGESSIRDQDHSMKRALIGGAHAQMYKTVRERFGIEVTDQYGMTEAESITYRDRSNPSPPGSCGIVSPDFAVRIVDDAGYPLGPNEVGELLFRPMEPNLMFEGYEGDDAATVEAWRDLWFHTGDLMLIDDGGHVFFRGRTADRIRRRGENVSATEVETHFRAHPEIADCVVVGVPSELGEDDLKIVLSWNLGSRGSCEDLHEWARQTLTRYMVPRYYQSIETIPKLPSGKPDRIGIQSLQIALFDSETRSPS